MEGGNFITDMLLVNIFSILRPFFSDLLLIQSFYEDDGWNEPNDIGL